MLDLAFIVSGLPASGKSTIGQELARCLGIHYLDKDDFLEALFEELGTGDADWRRKLSIQSNAAFEDAAKRHRQVVLISHWRSSNSSGESGTPTEWLGQTYRHVVEIHCMCPVETATTRFVQRTRHIGHCDDSRTPDEVHRWMVEYQKQIPLNVGFRVDVNTSHPSNIREIVRRIALLREDPE